MPALDGGVITELGAVNSLMVQLGPAMAGLQPVFTIINAVTSIFDLVAAVPALVAGDVPGFISKLQKATGAIVALARLQPAVAIPGLINDLLGVMVAALTAYKDVLTTLQSQVTQANNIISQAQAIGDVNLEAAGNCMLNQAEAFGEHIGASMGPFGSLLQVAQSLLSLVPTGTPALPEVGDQSSLGLDDLADFMDDLISVLSAIRIPGV
jgi:hypothetical protein